MREREIDKHIVFTLQAFTFFDIFECSVSVVPLCNMFFRPKVHMFIWSAVYIEEDDNLIGSTDLVSRLKWLGMWLVCGGVPP